MTAYPKKLIEVGLPLPEINDASAYDTMPGIGPHPKGIHQWWGRKPLPSARAVLFASVVDDPSSHSDKFPTEETQNAERERLFDIMRDLMQQKLHEKPEVYARAQKEMLAHCEGKLPSMLDPFAGSGSIPLEAARLGFASQAADLNPVAVLLNKCNLELIPRWVNHRPVNPEIRNDVLRCGVSLSGVKGLAEDVRFYGELVRKRVLEKIGHLYPQVTLPKEYGGREANVIAWLWARTVASPNPAVLGAHVPLINTYWLCSKKGHEAWLEPVIDTKARNYKFEICKGSPQKRTTISAGTQIRGGFKCLLTNTPIPFAYIRDEAINGRLQYKMIAIVAELPRGRTYVTVDDRQQSFATDASPVDFPDTEIPERALGFRIQNYGIRKHWQMFLPRQLAAMTTLSDFVRSVGKDVCRDAKSSGLSSGDAESYAGAITTFLALALDRCADFNNALCRWKPSGQQSMQLFGRQVIPMIWGFCEPNIMGEKAVCWKTAVKICADAIETIPTNSMLPGDALQNDAAGSKGTAQGLLVSTDPPYYDNVGYSDLSDFFYAWLRRTIGDLYPDLFRTILVPKALELTGAPERFGGDKEKARDHFESGFRKTFASLRDKMDIRFPLTVYYAFKQEDEQGEDDEEEDNGENETLAVGVDRTTGWETLLEALVGSGFQITATWPIRAVQKWRMRARSSNALASFIVLACRVRPATAQQCTRRDFLNALKKELPPALAALQQGNIAPVDLAQAAIGPGMAVFSRYSKIIESSDKPMTVRTALSLINLTLDEVLAESDAEYDADTRWALAWFEQYGMEDSEYGDAETLSRAKNTAVNGLEEAGIVISRGGKVRLLKRAELLQDWEPATDNRLTVWKATQYLIRALVDRGSETEAASLLRKMGGSLGGTVRELAYRLFKICERKSWSAEAQVYNSLVLAWPELTKLARTEAATQQLSLMN